MRNLILISLVGALAGCNGSGLNLSDAQIDAMDARCAQLKDQASCSADTADQCKWLSYGHACPATGPCDSGVCQGPIKGGGTITDGGATCPPPSSTCSGFTDETSCAADTTDNCVWYAYGRPCPATGPCVSGVCQQAPNPACQPDGGSGGSGGVGCACSNGGICVEENGAPIACAQPVSGCLGGASPCACLPSSYGSCTPSPDVSGLCICQTPAPSGCSCAPGQICVEQIGGPAMQSGTTNLLCVTPASGCTATDECGCVTGQGTCMPSASGPSQCTCDNGVR